VNYKKNQELKKGLILYSSECIFNHFTGIRKMVKKTYSIIEQV